MKGVVFNLLRQVVSDAHGEDVWDDLLDAAAVSGAYTSLGSYPDEELEQLVAAACAKLGVTRDQALRWFGRKAMPLLAESYPIFFTGHTSARTFLAGINTVIHAEVRKLYTGAECPHFGISETPNGALAMDYRSSRRMCALAHGFVEGAGDVFGEPVEFRHLACVDHGANRCRFEVSWPKTVAAAA